MEEEELEVEYVEVEDVMVEDVMVEEDAENAFIILLLLFFSTDKGRAI